MQCYPARLPLVHHRSCARSPRSFHRRTPPPGCSPVAVRPPRRAARSAAAERLGLNKIHYSWRSRSSWCRGHPLLVRRATTTTTSTAGAVGNVVFVTTSSRISAAREFDPKARTAPSSSSFNAGSSYLGDKVDKSFFGGQEPDAFFYGETIEKLGVDRYRIRKGGFTTCVQPTPRWEVTANSVTLVVDKRAILKNAVLKVKDVPLFYLPAMYFPINKEDRSTGFLMPVYGTSTIRGSSLSNAFFWAINRSQDLTLMHDWYTKTGQGYGGEYRYVASAGSNGEFRMYRLNERATTFQQSGQDITSRPARASRSAPTSCRPCRAVPGPRKSNHFSDVTGQQQYQRSLYTSRCETGIPAATSRARLAGGLDQRHLRHQRDLLPATTTRRRSAAGPERIQFTAP